MATKATVNTSPGNRISVNSQQRTTVRTIGVSSAGGEGVVNFDELLDVTAINPANNDTVVYDSATSKYVVKTLPIINGGTF